MRKKQKQLHLFRLYKSKLEKAVKEGIKGNLAYENTTRDILDLQAKAKELIEGFELPYIFYTAEEVQWYCGECDEVVPNMIYRMVDNRMCAIFSEDLEEVLNTLIYRLNDCIDITEEFLEATVIDNKVRHF